MKTTTIIKLKTAGPGDWEEIRRIAYITWPVTFKSVISEEQLDYMLSIIYNEQSLKAQMTNLGHTFILAYEGEKPVGFSSYEPNYRGTPQLMLHKIYLLPEAQGKGIGKLIFDYLTRQAKNNENDTIRLKVFHKNFKAMEFYQKIGFAIIDTETTDLHKYAVIDNVMIKKL